MIQIFKLCLIMTGIRALDRYVFQYFHFTLKWCQPLHQGGMCWLEGCYERVQKIQILTFLRALCIQNQGLSLKMLDTHISVKQVRGPGVIKCCESMFTLLILAYIKHNLGIISWWIKELIFVKENDRKIDSWETWGYFSQVWLFLQLRGKKI